MADKFVWSGATGAADGSSWADAYTTLMRDWGAEGTFTPLTDYIYVRSVHAESTGGPLTLTGSTAEGTAPCRVICCVGATTGTSPGALATGASVTATGTTDININEGVYVYGVEFYSSDDIYLGSTSADIDVSLDECRLELTGADSGDRIYLGGSATNLGCHVLLHNTDLDFSQAAQGLTPRSVQFYMTGGTVEYDINYISSNVGTVPAGAVVCFTGVDFTAMSSSYLLNLTTAATTGSTWMFSRCLLATGMALANGTVDAPGMKLGFYHCQIGTDADPAYQMKTLSSYGAVETDTTRYRTGGAKDPERTNPISWDMDTTEGTVRSYPGHALESSPITAWTDGDASTSHTYRIAIASDATIQDDEFWIELEGPNDAATNSMAVFQSSRVAPLTSAANLTTDSGSTWTGSGVGTKQYVEVSYTPDKPGPVTVRCYMAKASDNIYVDPKIQIDP